MPQLVLTIDATRARAGAAEFAAATKTASQGAGEASAKTRDLEQAMLRASRSADATAVQQRSAARAIAEGASARDRMIAQLRQELQVREQVRSATGRSGGGFQVGQLAQAPALLGSAGDGIASVISQAQQGAGALQSMAGSAALTAAQLGAIGLAGAGIALTAEQIGVAAKNSLELSRALAPIAALSADGARALETLKIQARGLADEAVRGDKEIAGLLVTLAESNQQGDRALARAATQAANAGLGDAAGSFAQVKAVLDAFKRDVSADEFTKVADTIVSVSEALGVNRTQLARALAESGTVASSYGVSLEALAAVIGKVGNRTGDLSGAGRGVTSVIRQLSDENDDLHKTFAALGVDLSASAFQGTRFLATIAAINDEIEKTPALREQVAGSDRNAAALLDLISTKRAELTKAVEAATGASGAAAAAETRYLATTSLRYDAALGKIGRVRDSVFDLSAILQNELGALSDILLGGSAPLPPGVLERAKASPDKVVSFEPEAAAKAVAAITDVFEKAPPPKVRVAFDAQGSSDQLHRAINLALERIDSPSIPVALRVLPESVNKALATITDPKNARPEAQLPTKSKEALQDALAVLRAYGEALSDASDLSAQLTQKSTQGFEREAQAIDEVYRKTLQRIAADEKAGVATAGLRDLAEHVLRTDRESLEVRKQIASDTAESGRLSALAQELGLRAQIARTIGDGATADRLELDALSAREDAARAQEAAQVAAARVAANGNEQILDAINRANAAREHAIELEHTAALAAKDRAAVERGLERSYRIGDLQAQLSSGLDSELASIANSIQRQKDAARKAFEEHPDSTRDLAAELELLNAIEGKEQRLARLRADQANAQDLAQLQRATASNTDDQLTAEAALLRLEQDRVRTELALRNATAGTTEEFERLFARQEAILAGRSRLNRQFGANDIGELLVSPELDFDLATVDLQIKKASQPIIQRLEDAFANPDLSADELQQQIEEARDSLDKLNQKARDAELAKSIGNSIGEGVGRGVKDIRHLGDVAIDVAHQIEDAFLQAFVTKPIANWASGLANTLLNNLSGTGGSVASARGNVFSNGEVVPFALGGLPDVGNQPALFRMPSGRIGSIREGGKDEAILPLERGANGVLGVKGNVSGGGETVQHIDNSQTVHVTMHVHTPDASSFKRSERQIVGDLKRRTGGR